MELEANNLLHQEGIEEKNMNLVRYIEMRYMGQWRTLSTPIGRTQSIQSNGD